MAIKFSIMVTHPGKQETVCRRGTVFSSDLVFGNRAALVDHTHLTLVQTTYPVITKIPTSPILNRGRRSFRFKQAYQESFKSKLRQVNFQFNLDGLHSPTIHGHWNFIFNHIASTTLSTIPPHFSHLKGQNVS